MKDFSNFFVKPDVTIAEAINIIDEGASQIALVVDAEYRLLGTLTDGDIRRGLIHGKTLESRVEEVMHREFLSIPESHTENRAMRLMREEGLQQIPVLDPEGRIVRLFLLEELLKPKKLSNWVVLMAGGLGKRLRPLTESCPKPMLRIGDKPLLEIILEKCVDAGFIKIFISVNYLKRQIIEHFGNGSRWGVDIHYLEEDRSLGTAGALASLPEQPDKPILVMNGDVLTHVNLEKLFLFHQENSASATICVSEYKTPIPYGVVFTEGSQVLSVEEKPEISHNINTGVYVLNPELLELLSPKQRCDMPELLTRGLKRNHSVIAFPIHEYWLDVGHKETLDQANREWK